MASRTSVFEMVHSVLAESKEKLASQTKTASATSRPKTKTSSAGSQRRQSVDFLKIADACDHLAKHIHLVNDERTPQEKLAEYAAIQKAIEKKAADTWPAVGKDAPDDPSLAGYQDTGDKGEHQEKEAPPESQSPKTPPLDSGAPNPGGPNTAIQALPNLTPGENPAEAGGQGESTDAHQTPESTSPTEAPNPMDPENAMETNKDMMMPEQPADVLKQAARQSPTYRRVWGDAEMQSKVAAAAKQAKAAIVMLQKAAQSGVPRGMAVKLAQQKFGSAITKVAEDALYPAQISAGTDPALQTDPGTPSVLSQGSEAGVNTPREAAPNVGEGSGRQYIASNEAAMNMTKGQAKTQNKGALGEILTEPALSSAHDKSLDQSLDNTSSAGVKISAARASAARELLRKFQESSPENARKVASVLKKAEPDSASVAPGGGAPPGPSEMTAVPDENAPASEPSPMPEGQAIPEEPEGEETPVVSDEALQAAESGVTPEELAQAEQLLAMQGLAGEVQAGEEQEEAPGAEEEAEKGSQGMGMSPSMPMSSPGGGGMGGGMTGGLGMA